MLETLARTPDFENIPDAESEASRLLNAIREELNRIRTALLQYHR